MKSGIVNFECIAYELEIKIVVEVVGNVPGFRGY